MTHPVSMCLRQKQIILKFFPLFVSLFFAIGCTDQSAPDLKKYSILTMEEDGTEFVNRIDALDTGAIEPRKSGVKLFSKPIWYDLIVKDNFYYRYNRKSGYFVKYEIVNQTFAAADSVKLDGFNFIDNYNWVDKNELLLISFNKKIGKLRYAKLQVETMLAKVGDMPLPLPSGAYNSMSVGFSLLRENLLVLGYTYHIMKPNDFTSSDTLYISTLEYSTLKKLSTSKDTRSTYPGSINSEQPNTFSDEQGDFYFMACPGIALGNNPSKPTAIYRIKNGKTDIDSSFFFNVSESPVQNHAYGMWYIGNGKAIIRSERKGLFTGMNDHYKVHQFDFFLFDINNRQVQHLDLPLDKGTSRSCVLTEKGLVYISVNGENRDNYIWILNPQSGELRRGMKIKGDMEYILRLERLN